MGSPLDAAVRALAAGRLVVYPTDTLLGVAARATDRRAVDRLLDAKGRPARLPISVAVSSTEELEELATLSPTGARFARRHLPGPYTLLAPGAARTRRSFAAPIVGVRGTIGFRIPDHPLARELARRAGPITATSANRHGAAPARSVAEARRVFGNDVATYLPATPAPSGRPSTLVDLTARRVRVVPRR
jgi:L-threonylcarbamoyladenylate synthase